jgi:hypothetical protein
MAKKDSAISKVRSEDRAITPIPPTERGMLAFETFEHVISPELFAAWKGASGQARVTFQHLAWQTEAHDKRKRMERPFERHIPFRRHPALLEFRNRMISGEWEATGIPNSIADGKRRLLDKEMWRILEVTDWKASTVEGGGAIFFLVWFYPKGKAPIEAPPLQRAWHWLTRDAKIKGTIKKVVAKKGVTWLAKWENRNEAAREINYLHPKASYKGILSQLRSACGPLEKTQK